MLSLSQKFSLNTIRTVTDSWTPTPGQDNMIAWWQWDTGISADSVPPYGIREWLDQSGNNYHMNQRISLEQPTAAGNIGQNQGENWFNGTSQHFDCNQITMSGDFTIALQFKAFNIGGCLLSDNNDVGEFMKLTSTTQLRMKFNNGSALNVGLDSGTWNDGNTTNMIVTRSGGIIKLWRNGVEMSTQAASVEDFKIDAFGIRRTDLNHFDGWWSDGSIYDSTSTTLTNNLIAYLNSI